MRTPFPAGAMTYLRDTDQVYVTLAAARAYQQHVGGGEEEARRELTELLLDARRKGDARSGAECWRRRSNTHGVDITAHVSRENGLAVITHVSVRDLRPRSERGARGR